jgi:RNA polymerase sigma-32 factor
MLDRGTNDIAFYVAQAKRAARLTREEELELVLDFRQRGDRKAADRLARAHLRDVLATALRYRRYGVPLSELVAEGSFGFVHALGKFDPARGVRLATYSKHWIRAYVLGHVLRTWSVVGGSGALRSRTFFRLRRERASLLGTRGSEEAAEQELARRLGVRCERVQALLQRLDARDVSLDAPASPASSGTMVERLVAPDDQEQTLAERRFGRALEGAVGRSLEALDARERLIAESRLMADPGDALSLADLGRRLGVSRERARQLEVRTKKKLRTSILLLEHATLGEWLTSAA